MICDIESVWLSAEPDVDRFKQLVAAWEDFCKQELRSVYTRITSGGKTQHGT
jgi:hypothetical protein